VGGTKTKPKVEPKAEEPVEKSGDALDAEHRKVIETLRAKCLEVEFTVHNLPKNRRITGQMAERIAHSVGGKKRGVRSSWSMFASEHPAVKELNAAVRDLTQLRDSWTIVRSAEVTKGADADRVAIEGGKRLIPVEDHETFYKLFVEKAKLIDKAAALVQEAMDKRTKHLDSDNKLVEFASIKALDKENAGEAWDASAYPADVREVVGVAKERNPDGSIRLDEDGQPIYVISFDEYHVSERLSKELRQRAFERLDSKLSKTVEAAMAHVVGELTDSLDTFKEELVNRTGLYPGVGSPYEYLTEHGDAEAVKVVTSDQDHKVPAGQVKVLVRYKTAPEEKTTKWVGPLKMTDYQTQMKPQVTGEKKKIYPTVIEGIISNMQAFRDRKAKMLGAYGDQVVEAFAPLLKSLTAYKGLDTTNHEAASKLAARLKTSEEKRAELAAAVADAMEALEDRVSLVKQVARRRTIKTGLIGKV
jgi:hypothetical protein